MRVAEPSSVHRETTVTAVAPESIRPNPNNPRRFFNERSLDELRASIQKVGILVPLIVYEEPDEPGAFVLLDGERRLICALELALPEVPVNTIPAPTQLDNILRMFNIHAVREEWPLISIALSLQDVMAQAGEDREVALSELTGLNRATVRRAKRLLSLPIDELELIRSEAHWPREQQVHREDLYLEVSDAVAAVERALPEFAKETDRPTMIRQLVRKREEGTLKAVTDFRAIPKLFRTVDKGLLPEAEAEAVIREVVHDVSLNPATAIDELAHRAFEAQDVVRKSETLLESLSALKTLDGQAGVVAPVLTKLRKEIDRLLKNN